MKNTFKTIIASVIAVFTFANVTAQINPVLQQVPQEVTSELSDADLKKFAEAFKGIQIESQESQEKMISAIEEEKMEVERFLEIQEAQLNPTQEADISEEEQSQLEKLMPKLDEIQQEAMVNMEAKITESGLSMERYQELAELIQQDPNLQQKVMTLLQE